MMLSIDDPDSDFGPLPLRYGQESISESQADVDVYPYPGSRSDAVLLLSLDSVEEVQLSGLMTAWQVASLSEYPSDPLTALAQWTESLENVVNSGQGSGYDLIDDDRGRTVRGFVQNVTWQRFTGSPYEVEWNMTFVRGGVVDVENEVDDSVISPTDRFIISSSEIGNGQDVSVELENPTNYSVTRQQEIDMFPLPQYSLPDYDANEIVAISGVVRKVTITGEIVGDVQARNKFDNTMRSLVGGNQAVSLQTAWPGYTITGAIEFYDSPREAGLTRINEYRLRIVEGLLANEPPGVLEPSMFDVLITDDSGPVSEGGTLQVDYSVTNTGDVADQQDISLVVVKSYGAGEEVDVDEGITLQSSDSTTGTLSWDTESGDAGEWTVRVQSEDDTDDVVVEVLE